MLKPKIMKSKIENRKSKIATLCFTLIASCLTLSAQSVPEKAPDALEQVMVPGGKIYVVLGVVLIIWFAILFFLFRTDSKLSKLEKELQEKA
jgi:CcmD family protein